MFDVIERHIRANMRYNTDFTLKKNCVIIFEKFDWGNASNKNMSG